MTELTAFGADAYVRVLDWALRTRHRTWADPTDLLALPMVIVSYWHGLRRLQFIGSAKLKATEESDCASFHQTSPKQASTEQGGRASVFLIRALDGYHDAIRKPLSSLAATIRRMPGVLHRRWTGALSLRHPGSSPWSGISRRRSQRRHRGPRRGRRPHYSGRNGRFECCAWCRWRFTTRRGWHQQHNNWGHWRLQPNCGRKERGTHRDDI